MAQLWRSFGGISVALGVLTAVAAACAVALVRTSDRHRRRLGQTLCGLWLVAVLGLTLWPRPGGRSVDLVPLRSLWNLLLHSVDWQVPFVQVLGNVALFAPAGMLVPLVLRGPLRRARWSSVAAAMAVAVVVEALQWTAGLGRVASVDDVLLAGLGSLTGTAVYLVPTVASLPPTGARSVQPKAGIPAEERW